MGDKQYYIYKTTCSVNDKYYIGAHYGELNDAYLGSGTGINHAIKKYGREAFSKEVLCVCTNREAMYFMENIFVSENEVKDWKCYNMKVGGCGGFTEETHKNSSERMKGNKNSAGRVQSEETRRKISESNKGKHSMPRPVEWGRRHSEKLKAAWVRRKNGEN